MEPGSRIGHYQVLEPLGAGGMGEVWLAHDERLDRQVALKVLPRSLAADAEFLARLKREAQMLAAVSHPGIATVHSIEDEGTRRFLVMELVEGETLAERLARGRIPLEAGIEIGRQVAAALEAAHDQGVIHRDLKPANIKLTPDGRVKLLDFGLAKPIAEQPSPEDLSEAPTVFEETAAGALLGTVGYMSPEQMRGQSVDKRTDIWSFGCVLYEVLTGRKTFPGETAADVMARAVERDPDWDPLPDGIPVGVGMVLRRCMNKDVRDRLRDIGDARLELAAPEAWPLSTTAGSPPRRWQQALPWAVAVVLGAAWLWPSNEAPGNGPSGPTRLEVRIAGDQLSTNVGSALRLSPTGDRLAFVVRREDATELYVRPLDNLAGPQLAAGKTAEAPYLPFFSPDGKSVGFVTPFELRRVPSTGGAAIPIGTVNRSRGAAWGDHDTIVVAPGPETGLFTMDASGGDLRELTVLENRERSHRFPDWLPQERAVLFAALSEGPDGRRIWAIEAVEPATGARVRVVGDGTYPTYSRSTGHLLFVRGTTLMAAPFDEDALRVTREPVPVASEISVNQEGGAQYSVAENGTLVYRPTGALLPTHPVLRVDRDGKAVELVNQRKRYGAPRYSPDGDLLALTAYEDANWDIWVYSAEGQTPSRITFHRGADTKPVWSADGSWIYFASNRGSGPFNVWRRPADGSGDAQRVRESPHDEWPAGASPDGKYLILEQHRFGRSPGLLSLALDGAGTTQVLVNEQRSVYDVAFSPDNRWFAYTSGETLRSEVNVRPFLVGEGRWQISQRGGSQPRWSSDGRTIYFRDDFGVQAVDVDTSNASFRHSPPRRVVTGDYLGGTNYIQHVAPRGTRSGYAVRPDGSEFVLFPNVGSVRGSSEFVILVLDWFTELGELVPVE